MSNLNNILDNIIYIEIVLGFLVLCIAMVYDKDPKTKKEQSK